MPNLQDLPNRRITARQVTSNRDGVLPNRRATELPNVAVRADMRTATRGDPTDELRRVLGMAQQGVSAMAQIETNRIAEAAPADSAQGSLDAAADGEPDPAKAKSRAYQAAFYGVRAETRFNGFATGIQEETEDLLNSGASPEEIQAHVLEKVVGFRDDVLETIPDPEAQQATGRRLSSMAAKLQADLAAGIKERTDRELTGAHAGNIQARLRSGQPVTFEEDLSTLTAAGIAPKEAKSRLLTTVLAVALDRDEPRPELLDQLLASKRADGKTPSLSPEEQMQVHDRVSQADSLVREREKRDREEKQKGFELKWYQAALDGSNVDDEIDAAAADGTFTPQEAMAWRNVTESLREGEAEGEDNENLVLDYRLKLADPRANPQTIRKQVIDAYNRGDLGTGLAAKRAFTGLMGTVYSQIEVLNNKAEARRNAAASGPFSARVHIQDGQELLDIALKPRSSDGFPPTPQQYRTYLGYQDEWRSLVAGGTSGVKAAEQIIAKARGTAQTPAAPPRQVLRFGADGRLQ